MPTNLYGPNDNFDPDQSHVLPGLIRKFHQAKIKGEREVAVWGTGRPMRELLHVDDLADACVFLMERYEGNDHINIGCGQDISIRELAEMVRNIVHPTARLTFDSSKPDGMPRKLLDVSRIQEIGWRHQIELRDGIDATYRWFLDEVAGQEAKAAREMHGEKRDRSSPIGLRYRNPSQP
jgi:GDP-L-fucose synthase